MSKNMQMTNEEIVRSYREAKHKGQQIGVLADLNVCSREVIIEILVEGGIPRKAFSRYTGENNIKRIKKEVKTHEAAKRITEEAAITNEALLFLKEKLEREYRELSDEWERVSAEYKYKLEILDRMTGGKCVAEG